MDSEGLLLITNDKSLTNLLLNPEFMHEREYIVLVEGIPSDESIQQLCAGVVIEGKLTLPAEAKRIERPLFLQDRIPPLALKPSLTYSYISLTIHEGRNRQVRKMTAHVGHPTIRLVRYRIANVTLGQLMPGKVRELSADEIAGLKRMVAAKPALKNTTTKR